MGCDIHLVLEKKSGVKWIGVDTFNGHESSYGKGWNSPLTTARNYERFAALASVRGDGPSPRGLPDFPSDTTALLWSERGMDAHSTSWLPLKLAAQVWLATDGNKPKVSNFVDKYPEAYYFGIDCSDDEKAAEDYRVVFWFDN